MINLVELFTLKFLDTAISSLKNIFMIKNKPFLSALSNAFSYLFYILLMKRLMSDTGILAIVATLVSVFIGQYATQVLMDKVDKESVWKISITPGSMEDGQAIADKLRENNIPVQTFPCYIEDMTKVLGVFAFSQSKAQSALTEEVLKEYSNVKFNIVTIKNRF